MKEEYEKGGDPYLFRYRPNNDNTLDEIKNSYIYFSDRESLNDPFDSNPDLINLVSENINPKDYLKLFRDQFPTKEMREYFEKNYSFNELLNLTKKYIPPYLDEFGIACFSIIPYVNMAMWANYTNNHKGICLQYKHDNDKEFFDGLRRVKYHEELNKIDFNPVDDEFKLMDVFYIKQKNWSYETELRLIKREKGKIKFRKQALRNVICGYNAEEKFMTELSEICKEYQPHVGVYKMIKPKFQNSVSLLPLN